MEKLPEGQEVVSTRCGAPIVRRPDRQLLRMQPNGRLAATIHVERVQSYLHVHETEGCSVTLHREHSRLRSGN
jgi:hypothetical protein